MDVLDDFAVYLIGVLGEIAAGQRVDLAHPFDRRELAAEIAAEAGQFGMGAVCQGCDS